MYCRKTHVRFVVYEGRLWPTTWGSSLQRRPWLACNIQSDLGELEVRSSSWCTMALQIVDASDHLYLSQPDCGCWQPKRQQGRNGWRGRWEGGRRSRRTWCLCIGGWKPTGQRWQHWNWWYYNPSVTSFHNYISRLVTHNWLHGRGVLNGL